MSATEIDGSLTPMHPISRPYFCGPRSPIDEWARCGPRRTATIWGTWPPNLSPLSEALISGFPEDVGLEPAVAERAPPVHSPDQPDEVREALVAAAQVAR